VPEAPFLELRGVDKRFGDNQVLRGIDLTVAEHQVVCLIGASGCGKSTLLRCVNALEPIQGGTISLRALSSPARGSTSTGTAPTSASSSRASTCSHT
jgi:ABC-type polar amino acid transport system ATPase subunit